ncbi:hypothetical protein BGZ83_009280 [Gryganskiella cystojenkinii]|nr:hypothetical protein BGZ83_009280 [Gryganskiella cystojenkinii]
MPKSIDFDSTATTGIQNTIQLKSQEDGDVLRSVRAGVVKSFMVKAGDSVAGNELLTEFEDEVKEAVKEEKK